MKKIKRSGAFRKKVKQYYQSMLISGDSAAIQNFYVKDCDMKTNLQEQQSLVDSKSLDEDEPVKNQEVDEENDVRWHS